MNACTITSSSQVRPQNVFNNADLTRLIERLTEPRKHGIISPVKQLQQLAGSVCLRSTRLQSINQSIKNE